MEFGNTLRCLIEDNDKTQKEVAEALNIAPTTLGNYIRNLREPDFNTLVAIANYFNVTTDFLLNNYTKKEISQEEQRLLNIFSRLSADKKDLYLEIGRLMNKH
ncbi:MAG: helix-turn-helix transcriptional regulator [Eubacterium sp.]|nr:helix-turn-helix transcriptional regulator [Eubacterium sp.]